MCLHCTKEYQNVVRNTSSKQQLHNMYLSSPQSGLEHTSTEIVGSLPSPSFLRKSRNSIYNKQNCSARREMRLV